MKKHKIMSLLLAILIMTITVTTSYAQSGNNTQILSQEYINEEDSGQTIYDKNIIESKSDNLFHVEKVGNKIYVDGVHEATVYELSPMINTLDNSTADADIVKCNLYL